MALDLKQLFKKAVEIVAFPVIDHFVKNWKTPGEIDDVGWAIIRAEIEKRLALIQIVPLAGSPLMVTMSGDFGQCALAGAGQADANAPQGPITLNIKDAFKEFMRTVVFPAVDQYVRQLKTPLEWDDRVWAMIKPKLDASLDQVEFSQVGPDQYDVHRVA